MPPSQELLVVKLPHQVYRDVLAEELRLQIQVFLNGAGWLLHDHLLRLLHFGEFVLDIVLDGAVLTAAASDAVASL